MEAGGEFWLPLLPLLIRAVLIPPLHHEQVRKFAKKKGEIRRS